MRASGYVGLLVLWSGIAGCKGGDRSEILVPEPRLSTIDDQSGLEDTLLGPIDFTITRSETDEGLQVQVTTDDPELFRDADLTLSGDGGSRSLSMLPAENASGSAEVTVTVRRGGDDPVEVSETFTVTIEPVNDPPTITEIPDQSGIEDVELAGIQFAVGDVDDPVEDLVVSVGSSNLDLFDSGSITIGGSGESRTLALAPLPDAFGVASITVAVTDGDLVAATGFTTTIAEAGDPPLITAIADQLIDEDDTTGPLGFTVSDSDTALASLAVEVASNDQNLLPDGNLTLVDDGGGSFTVEATPAADRFGTASVTVSVFDGANTTLESFDVEVSPINDPPTITAIPEPAAFDEDGTTGPLAFTVDDIDDDVTTLALSATSSNQTLVPESSANIEIVAVDAAAGSHTVEIIPASDESGTADITITVEDGEPLSASEVFTVTVNAVDDPPTISAIADQVIDEDESPAPTADFTVGDVDTALDSLTITATSNDQAVIADGDLQITGTGAHRTISFPPVADASGSAIITILVDDGVNSPATAETFEVTVNPVGDPPQPQDDAYAATANEALTVAADGVLANDDDPDGDAVTVVAATGVATSQGGSVDIDADGSFTYQPPAGFTGDDTFVYTATDGDTGTSDQNATVTITVSGPVVWYVDNEATAGGQGRAFDPFDTLLEAESASSTGETIRVDAGDGTDTGQDQGIALKSNQTLEGVGGRPLISNAGNTAITLADGVTVRGLEVSDGTVGIGGSCTAATLDDVVVNGTFSGGAISVTPSGALALTEVDIDNAGGPGISILSGGGTLSVTAAGIDTGGTTVDVTGGPALDLAQIALDASFQSLSSTSSSTSGIAIDAVSGSLSVTGDADGVGATTAITDPSADGIGITESPGVTIDFGDGTITGPGVASTVTGHGLYLENNAGASITIGLSSLDSDNGDALRAIDGGSVTIPNTGGLPLTATGGAALRLDSTAGDVGGTGAWTFSTVSSTSSLDHGVSIDGECGDVTITGATTIDSAAAASVEITDSTSETAGTSILTFGDLTTVSRGAEGVFISGTAGVIAFSGVTTIPDEADVNGNAVRVEDSVADVSFADLTANDGGTGVSLSNTTGSFTQSDGAFANLSESAVSMISASNVSLTGTSAPLTVSSTGGTGIDGRSVTNLTVANTSITAAGDADDEHSLSLRELSGTSSIEDVTFFDINESAIYVRNSAASGTLSIAGTATSLCFVDNHVATAQTGSSGVWLETADAGALGVTIDTCDFALNGNATHGAIEMHADGLTSTLDVDIDNVTIDSENTIETSAINFAGASSSVATVDILNTVLINSQDAAIELVADGSSQLTTRIDNTSVSSASTAVSMALGIHLLQRNDSQIQARITDSSVTDATTDGLLIDSFIVSGSPTLDVYAANNTLQGEDDGLQIDSSQTQTLCAAVSGNDADTLGILAGNEGIELNQGVTSSFHIDGLGGDDPATYVASQNPAASSVAVSGTFTDGTCTIPPAPQ